MKILVSIDGPSIEEMVSDRFARASHFGVYDSENEHVSIFENEFLGAAHGAGTKIVQMAADMEIDAIISAVPGSNASEALKGAGIPIYDGRGLSGSEAIGRFKKGELVKI